MNGGRSKRLREKSVFKIVGIVLLMVLVGLMFTIVDRLPVIGNPDSAPNRHVSDYYIEEGPELTHSPNLVTGVLADFRGFDTLLETTVMFLAGVSVAMILSNRLKRHWDAGIFRKDENFGGYEVKVIMPILIPVIIVYAFYVLMHGEVSLGGGFQAGALLAMAFMLYIMFADLGKNKFGVRGPAVFGGTRSGASCHGNPHDRDGGHHRSNGDHNNHFGSGSRKEQSKWTQLIFFSPKREYTCLRSYCSFSACSEWRYAETT